MHSKKMQYNAVWRLQKKDSNIISGAAEYGDRELEKCMEIKTKI